MFPGLAFDMVITAWQDTVGPLHSAGFTRTNPCSRGSLQWLHVPSYQVYSMAQGHAHIPSEMSSSPDKKCSSDHQHALCIQLLTGSLACW